MTGKPRKASVNDTQSLSRQIGTTASRLDRRKKSAMALGLSLQSRIRSWFTSPGGLAIAGGTGFLAAEWLHRPKECPRPSDQQQSTSARRSQTTALSKAVLLLKVALDMKTRWEKANPGVRQRTDERRAHEHAMKQPDSTQDTG
jgi:hypothetical protein